MDTPSIVQTIAVLAAVIVYLSKQLVDALKTKKNSGAKSESDQVNDLHKWHAPVSNKETGQPIFHWYAQNAELIKELREQKEVMKEMVFSIRDLVPSLLALKEVNETLIKRGKALE